LEAHAHPGARAGMLVVCEEDGAQLLERTLEGQPLLVGEVDAAPLEVAHLSTGQTRRLAGGRRGRLHECAPRPREVRGEGEGLLRHGRLRSLRWWAAAFPQVCATGEDTARPARVAARTTAAARSLDSRRAPCLEGRSAVRAPTDRTFTTRTAHALPRHEWCAVESTKREGSRRRMPRHRVDDVPASQRAEPVGFEPT